MDRTARRGKKRSGRRARRNAQAIQSLMVPRLRSSGSRLDGRGSFGTENTFPDKAFFTFKLSYETQVTSTTGSFALLSGIYLNSLSDPEASGGTRRPRYYSSLLGADDSTAPYGHYKVIEVIADLEGASNDSKVYRIGWAPEGAGASAPESMSEIKESDRGWTKLVGPQDGVVRHSQTFSMAALHGVSESAYLAEDSYGADAGSNASPAIQLHFGVQAAAAQTVTFVGVINLRFIALLSELRDVADS